LLERQVCDARACGFSLKTPSHGLFTHFRHRLQGQIHERLLYVAQAACREWSAKGEVVAVDGIAVEAYSQKLG
jgi:hypothetical protein